MDSVSAAAMLLKETLVASIAKETFGSGDDTLGSIFGTMLAEKLAKPNE